ncbi:AraC family transcriptional regulator [Amycolatopsis pithecellobii]|uniref:Helix-turn-helix domain-containing protein n=1 Tax=Amycolatopsis pithecellobii TaxID=664692 RepID=A0A6N7Z8A0_9PSEU|nr:AraC family transcriptional regulator [Amycolatopsis pithecellobii]MTD56596.1 helix-turn-helix domain-containing protein [Amycolatopsis pithecellobii]
MNSDIETFTVDTVDPGDRIDRWQEVLSTTHVPQTVHPLGNAYPRPFRASLRRRRVDDIAVIDARSDEFRGRRTHRDISARTSNYVELTIPLHGRMAVGIDDKTIIAPGAMLLSRHDRPSQYEMLERVRLRTVLIPQAALGFAAGTLSAPPTRVFMKAEPSVRLLISHIAALQAVPTPLSGSAAAAARNAVLELLVGAVRSQVADASTTALAALRCSIECWIDTRLTAGVPDQQVTAAAAAAAHSVSVRTLHRAFADGETFGFVVRSRRIERAKRDLVGEPTATIQSIAIRWGFADASHFCRAFKGVYGETPSDYRIAASAGFSNS